MSINFRPGRNIVICSLSVYYLFFSNSFAQDVDSQYRCQGRVHQGQNNIIILNLNLRLGGLTVDGDLNGDAIVGSVFGNSTNSVKIIAGRRSEMSGGVLAPIHKVTVDISKSNGAFNLEVLGVNGYSYFLSGSGSCR
jgi:hypothetical protein